MSDIVALLAALTPEVITFLKTARRNNISAENILKEYELAETEGRIMGEADLLPYRTRARAAIDDLKEGGF